MDVKMDIFFDGRHRLQLRNVHIFLLAFEAATIYSGMLEEDVSPRIQTPPDPGSESPFPRG